MEQAILQKRKSVTNQLPKLGFVGLGWIGRNRMEAIIKNNCGSAACIAEPVEENALKALEFAPDAYAASRFEDILEDSSIEGVVIATPSALHAEQTIRALEAGKAVFCQKPLGRTADEVRAVIETARLLNKPLGVDLSYRYTEAAEAIRKIIGRGELGNIYAIDLIFHNAYGPDKAWFYNISQSGGGCVMDLGIHLVDLALWFLDFPQITDVASALYHKGKRLSSAEEQVEDFASAAIHTTGGTIVNLQCSWNLPAGRDAVIEARFFGDKAGAAIRNVNGSFYDFISEKYTGTKTEVLASPPDEWSGRAGVIWAKKLAAGEKFDAQEGEQLVKSAEAIDRIYGR